MGGKMASSVLDKDRSRWIALSYPNYRRYWLAAIIRVFGMQFRFIGAGWLVAVELDQSPFWLGVVSLATSLPTIILSIPAGALADRTEPYRLLVVSQLLSFISLFLLALLIVTGTVTLWMVIVWALATGAFQALQAPSMVALLPRLVERPAMASAVALNSGVWGAMRIIGPAASGVLIALVGTGQGFFVAATVTAIALVMLLTIRLPERNTETVVMDQNGIMVGLRFIFSEPLFFTIIGLSFFTSVFGSSYVVLLPIFAEDLLKVGSTGFGFMEGSAGVGAIIGTYAVLHYGVGTMPGRLMFGFALSFGVIIAVFATTRSLEVALVLLLIGGLAEEVFLLIGMTVLQLAVPDQLRGRVMGIWTMTYFMSSIGGFMAGITAEMVGVRVTIAAGALMVSAFALAAYFTAETVRNLRGNFLSEKAVDWDG